MSSSIRDFEIETVDGKIQNVSSLCDFIKNTLITEDDINYLQSLCNFVANKYKDERELIDTLHEVLLEYYIKEYEFDIDEIIDTLEVFNQSFVNIDKKVYDDHIYLLFDRFDTIDVISLKNANDFINIVLSNLKVFVSGSLDDIYELMDERVKAVEFKPTNDNEINEFADNFGIEEEAYKGIDSFNNKLYKVKNGLFIDDGDELHTIVAPTLLDKNEHTAQRIVSINKKYQGFDLEEFVTLRDKAINGDLDDENEIQKFYYEVRYLINTMSKREGLDSEESEALEVYMNSLIQIYDNHKDILTPADKRNVQDYLDNIKKHTRKVA